VVAEWEGLRGIVYYWVLYGVGHGTAGLNCGNWEEEMEVGVCVIIVSMLLWCLKSGVTRNDVGGLLPAP
jgi:hypothetical protein